MKILGTVATLQALAKALGKPCMFISLNAVEDKPLEVVEAAPYLRDRYQIILDGHAYLVFDTDEEMQAAFNQTVGDDGPTDSNSYDGDATVYALTCGADGKLRTENT